MSNTSKAAQVSQDGGSRRLASKHLACAVAVLLLAAGCGPSAAAWTPTPVVTPTATPIPYSLTVHVADESGAPVAGASIILLESGTDQPVQTDALGAYTWLSINGPSGTLQISAPGYHAAVQPVALERGPNELAVFLQRDAGG